MRSPAEPAFPTLLSPLAVGPLTLRNRVILSGMTTGFGFEGGFPNEDAIAYFRARSHGVGMAVVGFGAVAPEGRVEQQLPWMWRDGAGGALAPLAAAIREAGAAAAIQLGHGGRQCSPRVTGHHPVAPSPVRAHAHVREVPRELATGEVEDLVQAFARAASVAEEAGFDAVEIHGGHGYIVNQFLSPEANLRRDRYGGRTAGARARFGVEVVSAVREAAPRTCVTVRMNAEDHVPGGLTVEDAIVAARAFEAAGADALVVSAGVYGSVPYSIPLLDDPEGIFLDGAAHVRAAVAIPVVGIGRITQPQTAEDAIREGRCDAVAVGRGLIADPEWVEKAAAGRGEDIRPCISTVQACAGMLQFGEAISCAVNPDVGRERRSPVPRVTHPAQVLVIGAGPAGMEAACRAAEHGHRVVLVERNDAVGGALRLAATTPVLAHLDRLVAWFDRRLRRAGIEVHTGTDAKAGLSGHPSPTLLVVATGAATAPPLLDGYEHLPAWVLEDAILGRPSTLGTTALPERPVVLGNGQRGLALALRLARDGARVAVVGRSRPGRDTSGLATRALLARLEDAGASLVSGRAIRLAPDGVVVVADDREMLLPADGVVVAEPLHPVLPSGLPGGSHAVRVGDAREPRDIASAIAEAREVVDAFTRERAALRVRPAS